MALQVWLPLIGDLRNQGCSKLTFSAVGSTISSNSEGKIGSCYKNTSNSSGCIVSNTKINLGSYVSMFCWVKMDSFYSGSSLTGILGQHRYPTCQGLGITMKYASSTTGYLSVNTGNGNGSRTYVTYCGSTLLSAGIWYHVGFTYNNGAIKLYVNGNLDGTYSYSNSNIEDYIQLFAWSFSSSSITNDVYGGYNLAGSLNDVRIYNHCLSTAEVKEIAKGLVLHYKLDDQYIESTTNIVPNSDTFSGWSGYTNGYTSISDCEIGGKKVIITNKQSWCGIYKSLTLPSTGTYTISVYCKPISRSSTSINQTLYTSGGGLGDINVSVSWNKVGEWQRISMTKTYTATSLTLYLIAYGGSNSSEYTVSCEYTMPQIEKLDHATPYTENSRSETKIVDSSGNSYNATKGGSPIISNTSPRYDCCTNFTGNAYAKLDGLNTSGFTNTYTISFWSIFKDGAMTFGFANGNRLNLFFSGNMYWNVGDGGGNPFKTSGGSAIAVSNYIGAWHHYAITGNGSYNYLYIDGNKIGTATTFRALTGSSIILNGWDTSSSYNINNCISDFRIYATPLSDTDIKKLYNSSITITNSGKLLLQGKLKEN